MRMRPGIIVFSGLFLLAGPAAAQVPGINLELVPRIGVYRPLSDLSDDVKLGGDLAIGLAAELDLPLLPIGLRANMDYATGAPISFGDAEREGENTVLTLVGDVVFNLLPRISPLQPYLLAGAGVKRYEFDPGSGGALFPEDASDFTGHLGAGLNLRLGPAGVLIEVSDYISSFDDGSGDSKLQNDLFATAGFRIGLF